MKRANGALFLVLCAGLYVVLFVGCTSEDNAGSQQNGGSGATQDQAGSGGNGGPGLSDQDGFTQTSGGTTGTDDGSSGSGGAVLQAGVGGGTAGDGQSGSGGTAGDEQGGSGGIIAAPVVGKSLAALKRVDSCDDVLNQIKERLRQQASETIEANLQQILDDMQSGYPCSRGIVYETAGADLNTSTGGGAPPPSESGASEYSTTNVQVVGVDEADFVKNDANYIYLVADGKLQIIDAWPAADAHAIALVEIRGTPKKLYVENNRAVVYSSLDPIDQGDSGQPYDMYMPVIFPGDTYQQECTYGYSCDFSGDGRKLLIQTYDISDKSHPSLLRETELSGSYLNSRRIGNVVHTVATFPEIAVPGLVYWPEKLQSYYRSCWTIDAFPFTEDELRDMFAALEAENEKVIDDATITDFLPGIKDTRYIGSTPTTEEGLLNGCDNFYISQAGDGRGFLSLISFDMSALDALNATTVVGKPGAVYASSEGLYVAVRHYSSMMRGWYFDDSEANKEATTVHKFRLSSDSISTTYAGSGVTKGRILNQFSMDELNGYLRIATTSGHVPDPKVHSTLSVLAEREGALEVVGIVDNIAPTEDIRSVRFSGEVGFIVTFKKTDPLFVIDLSEPTDPSIEAELKVPGFATYIHLMDDTHLLTMGYDAEDMDSFAWFQGIQLRVLDVSEMDTPTVLSEETIGTRGSSSDAATNHLAFNYFPQRDLLAIPMTLCEGAAGGGSYGNIMTFSGLLVYRVTVEEGFDLLGGVPHEEPETAESYGSGCSNWWTNSNSKVKRSIFMSSDTENFVYSIAMDLINISNLDDLEHPLVSVQLVENQ